MQRSARRRPVAIERGGSLSPGEVEVRQTIAITVEDGDPAADLEEIGVAVANRDAGRVRLVHEVRRAVGYRRGGRPKEEQAGAAQDRAGEKDGCGERCASRRHQPTIRSW